MSTEKRDVLHHAETPLWYNARQHRGNSGIRAMQLVGEFVDISGKTTAEGVIDNDEILFAKFIIAAMLFVSEPKMSSDSYAERLGVSRTNFFAHLKNVSFERPFDILAKLRICMAKQLLARTGMKVNEIATDVGKENTGYFSMFFKRQTGMTPLEYRSRWNSGLMNNDIERLGILEISMTDGCVWNVSVDKFAERLPSRRRSYLELVRG